MAAPAHEPFPANVDLDREVQLVTIEWDDGHRTSFTGGMLRWACPCAECRGEGYGTVGRLDRVTELDPDEESVTDAALVGTYALNFVFKSGHSTGIYTFRYLRGMCPCPECGRARD